MDKETMEIEKTSLERLLVMAGRDAEAIIKKRKRNTADDIALEKYKAEHPEDPFPTGSYVLGKP